MAKKTEIIFIIDKSGSMSGLEKDTVGGVNTILKEQKEKGSDAVVTTVFFNNKSETIYNGIDIKEVPLLEVSQYRPCGMTALLDALGNTIGMVSERHNSLNEEEKPEKTLVVITTDGFENCSKEFSKKAIVTLIKAKEEAGWEFLFLGADMDAIEAARDIGIRKERAARYCRTSEGSKDMFYCLGSTVSSLIDDGVVDDSWKDSLEGK
ncbi:MAG: hypothetical protein MJ238_04305 [Bacilli bacterium]|nr:hypothetical protein [Bacilli bacterium]